MGHGGERNNFARGVVRVEGVVERKLLPRDIGTDVEFKRKIVWINVVGFVLLHLAGLYGLWLCFSAKVWTNIYSKFRVFEFSFLNHFNKLLFDIFE